MEAPKLPIETSAGSCAPSCPPARGIYGVQAGAAQIPSSADLVPLSAKVLDAAFEHVANRHEPVLAEADARRRSRRQKVSGLAAA
jgi:hypothetical protein